MKKQMQIISEVETNSSLRYVVKIGDLSYLRVYSKLSNYIECFVGLGVMRIDNQNKINKLQQEFQNLLAAENAL